MITWMEIGGLYFAVGVIFLFVGPASRLTREERCRLERENLEQPKWKFLAFDVTLRFLVVAGWPVLVLAARRHEIAQRAERPRSAINGLIGITYDAPPAREGVNFEAARRLCSEVLLGGVVPVEQVHEVVEQLGNGPMLYSTHDLAAVSALNIFQNADPGRRKELKDIQFHSRLILSQWLSERKVAPLIAWAFEEALYKMYKFHANDEEMDL